MAVEDRFKQSVIVTLAKRAANRCSNPNCGAITSGPTEEPNGSVNVGEAAHIYGANPGSARYDPDMTSTDRSAITNAIWLCSNCHKLVDDDPIKSQLGCYSSGKKSMNGEWPNKSAKLQPKFDSITKSVTLKNSVGLAIYRND